MKEDKIRKGSDTQKHNCLNHAVIQTCQNRGLLGGFCQWISTVRPDIQIPEEPTQNRTDGQLKLVETQRLTAPSAQRAQHQAAKL